MSVILKTENLTKDYGNERGAIDINIEIKPKEIVGFIGPNGAGKTTTMRMLTTLLKPDRGLIELFGQTIASEKDYLKVADKIGFLPSEGGLYEYISSKKLLEYAADLYNIDPKEIDTYATAFKLDLNVKIKKLSLGNKRKVGVIQALMHNPKLLILDEPTAGLDPLMQKQVLELIVKVKENGGAVLLSSHNLAEVESVCDRIIMIKSGKIIFKGKTNEILKKALKRFRIENVKKNLFDKINELATIKKIDYVNGDVIAYVEDTEELLTFLVRNKLYDFFLERPTLEETFINQY